MKLDKNIKFDFLKRTKFIRFIREKAYLKLQEKIKTIAVYAPEAGLSGLLMAIPFYKVLRQAFPGAKISYLGDIPRRYEKILKAIVYFDDYIHFERPTLKKGFKKYGVFRKEFKGKIDMIIDTQFCWQTSLWLRLLGVKYMLTSAVILSDWPVPKLDHKKAHVLERLMVLSARLGMPLEDVSFEKISIPAEFREKSEKLLAQYAGKKFAAIIPGCGTQFKNWPIENFAAIGDMFYRKGYNVLLLGSRDEIELLDKVSASMKQPAVIPARWDVSFAEEPMTSAAILEKCEIAVGNDSGGMHLASSLGCLSAVIFGPTSMQNYAPIGPRNINFYKKMPCSPCRFRCERSIARECLVSHTPEEVFARCEEELKLK